MDGTMKTASPLFQPRRLTHFNLQVDNLKSSVDFYHSIIGFGVAFELPLLESSFLSNGNTNHDVALMSSSGANGDGSGSRVHHLAFELETEVDLVEGYRKGLDRDLAFWAMARHTVSRGVYVADPGGLVSEIYADVVEDWRTAIEEADLANRKKAPWVPGSETPVPVSCYPVDPPITRVSEAAFRPTRPTSACIVAADYEATHDFYAEVVGLTPSAGGRDGVFTSFTGSLGSLSLSLFRSGHGHPVGIHHLSFEVSPESDLDKARRKVASMGVEASPGLGSDRLESVFVTDPSNSFVLKLHLPEQVSQKSIGSDYEKAIMAL